MRKKSKMIRASRELVDLLDIMKINMERSTGKKITRTHAGKVLAKTTRKSGILIIIPKKKKRFIEEIV